MLKFLVAAVLALALSSPAQAAVHVRADDGPMTRYGKGVNGLMARVSPRTLPTALGLAQSAVADADEWWARQGSRPPAAQLTVGESVDGTHNGFGYYGSGRLQVTPEYLANLSRTMKHSATRRGSVEALVGLWRLMAHERGHNIGYQHIPGGIMDETWASPPGQAYEWASSMLGPRHR